QLAQAAEVYHKATGAGRIEAFVDVQALDQFPQEHAAQTEESVPLEDVAGSEPFVAADEQEVTDRTVPDESRQRSAPAKQQRVEVQITRDSETISMASEELPPWNRDQIEPLVRDERLDDAAQTLTEHTVLQQTEAPDLTKIIANQ